MRSMKADQFTFFRLLCTNETDVSVKYVQYIKKLTIVSYSLQLTMVALMDECLSVLFTPLKQSRHHPVHIRTDQA